MKALNEGRYKVLEGALGQGRAAPMKPRERHFSISF
jgi:hypothetical protein